MIGLRGLEFPLMCRRDRGQLSPSHCLGAAGGVCSGQPGPGIQDFLVGHPGWTIFCDHPTLGSSGSCLGPSHSYAGTCFLIRDFETLGSFWPSHASFNCPPSPSLVPKSPVSFPSKLPKSAFPGQHVGAAFSLCPLPHTLILLRSPLQR